MYVRIFNHDIMTEWYHYKTIVDHLLTPLDVWLSQSLTFPHFSWLIAMPIYATKFIKTVDIIKKNWSKESCYCIPHNNHTLLFVQFFGRFYIHLLYSLFFDVNFRVLILFSVLKVSSFTEWPFLCKRKNSWLLHSPGMFCISVIFYGNST